MTMRAFIEIASDGLLIGRILTSSENSPDEPMFEVPVEVAQQLVVGEEAPGALKSIAP